MFNKMLFVLIVIVLAVILFDPIMPHVLKQILYSISLTIKSLIVLVLPVIIFCMLFKTVVTLSKGATKIIGIILFLVCCSNLLSTFVSNNIGIMIYNFDLSMVTPNQNDALKTLWSLKFPVLIANNKAMFAGIILGIISSKLYPNKSFFLADKIERFINKLMTGFIYIIPLFVAGFVVKMQYDGVIGLIIKDYVAIFALIALSQFAYILLIYFLLNYFSPRDVFNNIKYMLPAILGGFSTMSSAATMPLTIIGAERSAKNKNIVRSVIPFTVNIHLVGDCFAIPILAYAVLKTFGVAPPSLYEYFIFSLYFVIAKFSVASVPGGGIIVMLPILETYLGFNAEMLSLITALYILFDPVITSANVFGNGAFAKMIDNILSIKESAKYKLES